MKYFLLILIPSLLRIILGLRKNYINATAVVLLSLEGPHAYFTRIPEMLNLWEAHLAERIANDPNWPVNISVEFYDAKGDMNIGLQLFLNRTKDTRLPPVSIVIGPEDDYQHPNPVGLAAKEIGMPVILVETNPVKSLSTTFYVIGRTMIKARSAVDLFIENNIKSIAIMTMSENLGTYNLDTCREVGDLLASREIHVTRYIIPRDVTLDYYVTLFGNIRDQINPDVMMFCDWESCQMPDFYDRNPLYAFKQANYLPKALYMTDCMCVFDDPRFKSLYEYVIVGTFSQTKCLGTDYTEDATPFSSYFRPRNTANLTFTQDLNVGWVPEYPSSAKLFFDWYKNMSGGSTPIDEDPALWAAFDVIESALYRAAEIPEMTADKVLAPSEVLGVLHQFNIRTPFGRVAFDSNNVNSDPSTIVAQANPLTGAVELVAPTIQASAPFVYPMPSWDERVYKWALFKFPEVKVAMSIAVVCSFILVTIIVTVIINHNDMEIRMLHYGQISLMCLAACILCWGLVFLWQADVQLWQCQYYPWAVFLPTSFMVNIANMKAYRLSTFLRAGDKRPKPFPHSKVLKLAVGLTMVTVVILLVGTQIEPLTLTTVVVDRYRPSLDLHHCTTGRLSTGLLYFVVFGHLVVSAICVFEVRNGFEGFRDGTVMKESFLILYGFWIIAVIMNGLSLPASTTYLARCACVSIGVTLFCLRMLISRCVKFWIPVTVRAKAADFYESYMKPILSSKMSQMVVYSSESVAMVLVNDNGDSPVYTIDAPQESSLLEMERAMDDPNRTELFESVAKSAMVFESLSFLKAARNFKSRSETLVQEQSAQASNRMKELAKQILDHHIGASSAEEVNVSSKCATALRKALDDWATNIPIVSPQCAQQALAEDSLKRVEIFAAAYKEVSILLYQNIWSRFRTVETQQHMSGFSSKDLPMPSILSSVSGKVYQTNQLSSKDLNAQVPLSKYAQFRIKPVSVKTGENQDSVGLTNTTLPIRNTVNTNLDCVSVAVTKVAEEDEMAD